MRVRPALLAVCCLAAPRPASAEAPPPAAPAPTAGAASAPAPTIEEITGTVAATDLRRHRVTVATAAGPVEVGWDRNTLIYVLDGATTALDLRPGVAVRVGLDPVRNAYWIQVGPSGPTGSTGPAAPGAQPPVPEGRAAPAQALPAAPPAAPPGASGVSGPTAPPGR